MGNLSIHLTRLYLGGNQISGTMPVEFGNFINLNVLGMEANLFMGTIPDSIGKLQRLQRGVATEWKQIISFPPTEIQLLENLGGIGHLWEQIIGQNSKHNCLNLSFNNLEGEVPIGVFGNGSEISVVGYKQLCGGISSLDLPRCKTQEPRTHRKSLMLKLTLPLVGALSLLALLTVILVFNCTKESRKKPSIASSFAALYFRTSYEELFKATDGFASENLISMGSFGSVYKGVIHQEETPIAVKVINLQQRGAAKSFMLECEALRKIRHRNLLKSLTSCSIIDFRGYDFKALVFDFTPKGSLEKWLHHQGTQGQPLGCFEFYSKTQRSD
ncbi:probable LRR receptor-like serine/threonine-protein kinase At3g47570 [Camellia sinensis]|uniref:probable LRR receptor-like serine/threonine-protein kinase At3g47570 n=1 Tax=Camellia sinensis TaxID=4442 RepID=UPI001035B31D|nr:probable LRR receptor-like serine/threonine-protein kinase At3g47570 [Camellia sinensis]